MTSRVRRTTVLSLGLLVAAGLPVAAADAAPGRAAGVTVDVVDMAFAQPSVTVPLGGTVTWRFADPMQHSSTSDNGFWDSELHGDGDSWSRAFTSAGSFGYFCTTHSDMQGKVLVRPTTTGKPKAGYTVRWANKLSAGTAVDVQVRGEGSGWETWQASTTSPSGRFDRAGTGTWKIRARTVNTTTRATSGWSPVVKVAVR